MNKIAVLDRVIEKHPELTKEDAAHTWFYCKRSMLRVGKEPEEHIGIGYDPKGRLLEVFAIRNSDGDWLIKHAQTPPQERIVRELGIRRRRYE